LSFEPKNLNLSNIEFLFDGILPVVEDVDVEYPLVLRLVPDAAELAELVLVELTMRCPYLSERD
jgi:succinyl-CoA synthetase beta subunit